MISSRLPRRKALLTSSWWISQRPQGDDVEDNADRGRFDKRAEGLLVVHAVVLGKTANNPASLME